MSREELFRESVEELLQFVIEKDKKYAGNKPLGNILDTCRLFDVSPTKICLWRINDKWNRLTRNMENEEIVDEEIRDIWGYCLIYWIVKNLEWKE